MYLISPYGEHNIKIIVGKDESVQHVTKLIKGPDGDLYYKLNNNEESNPLQINTEKDDENFVIKMLSNDYSTLRVHVILSNFFPYQTYYNNFYMNTSYPVNKSHFDDVKYIYNENIIVSKEKLYIQSRKLNKNLIGNMLRKPTTLLVPLEKKKATVEKKDIYGNDSSDRYSYSNGKIENNNSTKVNVNSNYGVSLNFVNSSSFNYSKFN